MKNKVVLFVFLALLAGLVSSYSGGYAQNGNDGTGATGQPGCSCHGSSASITTVVELDSAGVPVTSYIGGHSYTVKIHATNTITTTSNLPAFGFQLAVVKASGAGTSNPTQAGTWGTSLPANVQNTSTGASGLPIPIIEQSTQIPATTGTGGNGTTYVESIPWTAPAAGTGSVVIYGVLNAVNNNMNSSGDKYHVANAVTITEAVAVAPVASVSISQTSGTNPTCSGSSVTFTATPTNGGTTPSYQWKVNGVNAGTNSATFTTTTLTTGAVVTCVMTSNLGGVTGSPATSNGITMTINPSVTPSVSIAASTTTICAGASVTFTATPTNGGTTPSYQWKVGTTNVGTNSPTYTTTTLTNGQVVSCVMTSNASCASPATATSNTITMTVNPSVTPSVSIAASTTTICAGGSVTFTATPTNGGTTPSYQWKVGTTNVGTNSPTYTTTTLTNGQVVSCVMTSNAGCASPATATSNTITITVSGSVTPAVSIAASTTTICTGGSVTFTATPTNGGTTPSYQWKVGTTNVGTNSPTFTTTTLTNGQVVTCILTSSSGCASPTTATSNAITITVSGAVTPSVSITTPNTTICAGASVTFTATPTNGGTTPSYQWKVGTTNVGTNSPTYTTTTLTNGQVVSCILTSSSACASPTTATSNTITMTVNPSVSDAVSIAASATTICAGQSVTFTATPTNGGATPVYQWKVNGTNAGTNSATFTTTTLTNGAVVTCVMTPTATCANPAQPTSNAITMIVNPTGTDAVSIAASTTTICSGTSVTFTATPTNGGSTPSYQWKVNGVNAGTNSATFTTTTLTNNAVVTCVMTPSGSCVSPPTATSNAITMTVSSSGVTDSVNISTASTSVCAGASVTFTANPFNGGSTPAFQWKVNGVNAGTNSPTFTTTTLTNGAVVTCVLTPSGSCATPASSTSNALTMTVGQSVMPTIHITTPTTSICPGTQVTFTATATNGGTSPTYQWKINGTNTGTNSNTLTSAALTNGAIVTCQYTSSSACAVPATVTSNGDTITVTGNIVPTIVLTGATAVCSGSADTFTAHITGGGTSPSFAWRLNGAAAGTNSSTFIVPSVSAAATVTCTLTSSSSCASPATALSNTVNVSISPVVTPTIQISTPNTSICQSATAQFSATITNGGTSPLYQWYINTNQVGTANGYSSSSLFNGDVVSCVLTSNATCASPRQLTSNLIQMTVNPLPTATLVPSGNVTVCAGDSVQLNAGGGTGYHWSNSAAGSSIWVSQSGNYSVTATDANGCSATPLAAANIIVSTPAVPTITQNGNTLVASTAVRYQWQLNGNVLGGADTTQLLTMTQSGSYAVTTVDVNGCSATSTHYIFALTGINGIGADLGVRLYPVPNRGSFAIDMTDYSGAEITIYDVYGSSLYHQSLTASHQEVTDLSLAPALYFVQVTAGGRTQTIKMQVIKE